MFRRLKDFFYFRGGPRLLSAKEAQDKARSRVEEADKNLMVTVTNGINRNIALGRSSYDFLIGSAVLVSPYGREDFVVPSDIGIAKLRDKLKNNGYKWSRINNLVTISW